MTITYVAGRFNTDDSTVRDARAFGTWAEARQHVEALATGGVDETTAAAVTDNLDTWVEPVFRSVAEGLHATRLFLYPAVLEDGNHRLACPRCLLGVVATEMHHGDIVGSLVEALSFSPTMPRVYRVYCEGDCDAESDECEDLLDAIDGFMLSVTWPSGHVPGTFTSPGSTAGNTPDCARAADKQ